MKSSSPDVPHAPHNGSHPTSRYWTLLFWFVACGLTFWLFTLGGSYDQLNGTVDFKLESVASLEDAQVAQILVTMDQHVVQGTPVVQMDTSLIDQEIEALKQELEIEHLERQRRFTQMVQDLRAKILQTELQQTQNQAELEVLNQELVRLESLLSQRLIEREVVIRQKARVAVLQKNLEELPKITASYRKDLAEAEALYQQSLKADSSSQDSPVSKQIELLNKRRDHYTLRAANDGIIAQLLHQRGEIVAAGETILKLIIKQTSKEGKPTKTVRGFLPEKFAHYAELGTQATVYSQKNPESPIKMEITSVTPHLLSVPDQASALPNSVQRGRFVNLSPLPGEPIEPIAELLHGESVIIRMNPRSFIDLLKQF